MINVHSFKPRERISKMEVECLALKDLTSPRNTFGLRKVEGEGHQSVQKENMCPERRRSVDAPSALLLGRKGATPDITHITPIKHSSLPEPWTPTANLKMLISAASPDIRDREVKKVLFRPMENDKEPPTSPEQLVVEEDHAQFDMDEDDLEKKPSRKEKSLGLLCQKFLALYPDDPPPNNPIFISLDKVATSLGVERRRIYDIVNVLESLMIMGRMAKNSYTWFGRRSLEVRLKELQSRGREQGYHLHMEPQEARGDGVNGEEEPDAREGGANMESEQDGEGNGRTSPSFSSNRKDKSLRIMSQKFVMLFLVSKTQIVTLDTAAKILIEESQDSTSHSKYKTKVRRLYDIANILTSLDLIKKVHVREETGRKPAFKWLGSTEFNSSGAVPPSGSEATQRLKLSRHSSFNITPTSVAVQRLVSSAPCSPHREQAAEQNQPVDYSRTTAVCRLHFGTSSETHFPPPNLQMHRLQQSPSSPQPPCMAYLPSLSQPSVVMLCRAPDATPQMLEGQRSPLGATRKRSREGEEELPKSKKGASRAENELRAEDQREAGGDSTESKVSDLSPSHYLYVPNSAGLNSLNFLLSSAHSGAALTVPSGSVPTLAVPYVLLPSSSLLPCSPLITSPLQTPPGAEVHPRMSYSLPPAVVTQGGQLLMGTVGAFGRGPEMAQTPCTPEQTPLQGALTSSTRASTQEPQTPVTPKENMASATSKSFFQTPANSVGSAPKAKKRGSAQRRLDVGLPPNHENHPKSF